METTETKTHCDIKSFASSYMFSSEILPPFVLPLESPMASHKLLTSNRAAPMAWMVKPGNRHSKIWKGKKSNYSFSRKHGGVQNRALEDEFSLPKWSLSASMITGEGENLWKPYRFLTHFLSPMQCSMLPLHEIKFDGASYTVRIVAI